MYRRVIDIRHWIPRHLYEWPEYVQMAWGEDIELGLCWDSLESISNNIDIDTMDRDTLTRWLDLTGTDYTPDQTDDELRILLYGVFVASLPYTEERLLAVLDTMLEDYDFKRSPSTRGITVTLQDASGRMPDNLYTVLRAMVPAHIGITLETAGSSEALAYLVAFSESAEIQDSGLAQIEKETTYGMDRHNN